MLATRTVDARRWYDANGNIVKRVRDVTFVGTRFGNPLTGASVPYSQHDLDTEHFGIPGDLDSATTVSEEHFVVRGPRGVLTVDSGRTVTAPDGTVLSYTGRRDLGAYYSDGDRTKVDLLCAALGA